MVDKVSGVCLVQDRQINSQKEKLRAIQKKLRKDNNLPSIRKKSTKKYRKDSDDEDDENIPDLYSVRRSPFYQKKITQLQLNDHILNTRKNLLEELTQIGKGGYDIQKCIEIMLKNYDKLN